MCGRYLLHAPAGLIERAFGIEFSQTARELGAPRFNIAPTQRVPIVRNPPGRTLTIIRQGEIEGGRELVTAKWGLIPAWAKDPSIGPSSVSPDSTPSRRRGAASQPTSGCGSGRRTPGRSSMIDHGCLEADNKCPTSRRLPEG